MKMLPEVNQKNLTECDKNMIGLDKLKTELFGV